MNIAFVSRENAYTSENNGGIGTYTKFVANMLSQNNNVYVITFGIQYKTIIIDNLYIHIIKKDSLFTNDFELESHLIEEEIKCIQKKYNVHLDIIEIPEWLGQASNFKSFRKRIVTKLHTPLFLIEQIENRKIYKNSTKIKFNERRQIKNSQNIISPSNSLRKIILDELNKNSIVLPNPIDVTLIEHSINNIGKYKECYGNYALFLGRLEKRKGIIDCIPFLKKLIKTFNYNIVFCGRDSLYNHVSVKKQINELMSEFQNKLFFIDHLYGNEKYELIKESQFIFCPSLWENFSYVSLEAMCLKKLVIASSVGGFTEQIEDNKSGILIKDWINYDINLLKELLTTNNKSYLENNAYNRVKSTYDSNILKEQYELIYNNILYGE